jgi:molybdenum cofactor cytidylyltransferase
MAPDNKLLSPIGGEPMIRRVVVTVLASGLRPVIVVTGYEADRVVTALSGLDVIFVTNAAYSAGLSASLRAGLEAVPADADGALICLGDMPWVDVSVIQALIAAFTGQKAICVPVHRGQRGNPVLWGRSYFSEMVSLTGDSGAKPLMSRHAAHLVEVDATTDGILYDIDTPADLVRLNKPRDSR